MSKPSKEYLAEYRRKNADKIKAQQAERDRRKREERNADPAKLAAYRARRRAEYLKQHPDAQTAEERRKKDKRNIPTVNGLRVCCDCHQEKKLEEFPRHGPRGRKAYCASCCEIRIKANRRKLDKSYVERNREKVNAVKAKWQREKRPKQVAKPIVVEPVKRKRPETMKEAGWRLVFCYGDQYEICRVYMKGLVIRYVSTPANRSYGDYTVGKSSYGIAFDDSGKRYQKLEYAERVAM